MKQVLIRPPWDAWLQNRMFSGADGCVYTPAFILWRQVAAAHGYQLDTWDMHPLAEADCVWMMDLPPNRSIYRQARRDARQGVPFVLQMLESPLLMLRNYIEANRRHFELVVTFEHGSDGEHTRFGCQLPNTLAFPLKDLPFAERRCAVMLNSNRVEGYFAVRQVGLTGLPGVGPFFGGWKLPLRTLANPAHGELYSWRRQLARVADTMADDVLDVFGFGWKGEPISWFAGFPNRPYRCAVKCSRTCTPGSINRTAKAELFGKYCFGIAVENYQGALGYISEKLFDVLMAGAVPVYLGEERITELVPSDCFIDARHFPSHRQLLLYLRGCSEREWRTMREQGQAFLQSERMRPFTDEAFAEQMVAVLDSVSPIAISH